MSTQVELPRAAERLGGGERPVVRPGSWIGGDRDGNPNVDAGVLRHAITRQAEVAFKH